MTLTDYKFSAGEFSGQDVASLPDRPGDAGITAAQLKARFDNIPKMMIALGKFNRMIDALMLDGASGIGGHVDGLAGSTLAALLAELKARSDGGASEQDAVNRALWAAFADYYSRSEADGLLNTRLSVLDAAALLKEVDLFGSRLTFHRKGGGSFAVELPIGNAVDQNSGRTMRFWYGTRAQYNALPVVDPDTEYNLFEE